MLIKVVLADDHLIVREGLKSVLRNFDDLQIGAEIGDYSSLTSFDFSECDMLVLDLSFQGQNTLPLIAPLRKQYAHLKILVLSVFDEDQYAIRAIENGASGYLSKEAAADQLVAAIRLIARGEKFVSKRIENQLTKSPSTAEHSKVQQLLSGREFEVFLLMGQATPTSIIAKKLLLNPKTVSTYKKRILSKLSLDGRGELVKYAIQYGFIPGLSIVIGG